MPGQARSGRGEPSRDDRSTDAADQRARAPLHGAAIDAANLGGPGRVENRRGSAGQGDARAPLRNLTDENRNPPLRIALSLRAAAASRAQRQRSAVNQPRSISDNLSGEGIPRRSRQAQTEEESRGWRCE